MAYVTVLLKYVKLIVNAHVIISFSEMDLYSFTIAEIWVYQDEVFSMDLLSALLDFAKKETDMENLFRAVVAIGNLVFKFGALREAAPLLGANEVRSKCLAAGDARLPLLVREIDAILAKGA